MVLLLLEQGVAFGLQAGAMQARAEAGGTTDLPGVDAALRDLIASADPGIFPEPASLKGTANSISLLTTIPGPDGVRQRVDAVVFASDGRLKLRWTRHRHVAWLGPVPPAQDMTLLDGVRALVVDYAAPGHADWQPGWMAETLPALVRLRIGLASPAGHWPPIVAAPKLATLGQ